jgi:NtrC-family two-component system response regulator AlgB
VAADHMRVLIIDDEANIRRITAVALEGMGHQTAVAEDGNEALRQLAAAEFDAAFLDLRLHDENGMELLPKLLESRPGLEVIIFSAGASAESAKAAQQAGAAGFMAKPFTVEEIRQALGNLPGSGPWPNAA